MRKILLTTYTVIYVRILHPMIIYSYVVMLAVLNYTFVVPSEPQLLREAVSVNSSSVTLQWRPPVTPNGIIIQYSLQYNTTAVANTTNNVLIYTVSGLSPDTVYTLQLRAHTSAGAGPPSIIIIITCKLLPEYCHISNYVCILFYV